VGLKIRLDRTQEIGVGRRATKDELAALDERGFVIVPALLADEEVDLHLMLHLSGLGEMVGRDEGITSLFQGGAGPAPPRAGIGARFSK
jgi:hypothetical protein